MTKSSPVQTLLGCNYFNLKMEAAYPFEGSLSTHNPTWCPDPEAYMEVFM
jgi:hypothetical protein